MNACETFLSLMASKLEKQNLLSSLKQLLKTCLFAKFMLMILYLGLLTSQLVKSLVGHCCAELLWMRQTLRDYGYKLSKVPLLCENESAIHMADNPVEHSRTKHIDIRYHFLRDHQQKGDIEIAYVNTHNQLADIFTKPLDEKTFSKLRNELNILDSQNFD
jgi:hypothetical protein